MYSREVDGEVLDFGVSGKLIRNTLVMYDRQTESLWSQLLGEAVDGPLEGTVLIYVPAVHIRWQEWRELHPDTLALVKGYQGARDSYASYYNSSQTGVIGERYQDDRLYAKEFVVGVALDGAAVAYPFGALSAQSTINDQVGETPVVVLFAAGSGASVVYDRRIEGNTLNFSETVDGALVDAESGTLWDRWSGEALAGPLVGSRLEPVKSTAAFWFGWKDWYPDSAIYGLEG